MIGVVSSYLKLSNEPLYLCGAGNFFASTLDALVSAGRTGSAEGAMIEFVEVEVDGTSGLNIYARASSVPVFQC